MFKKIINSLFRRKAEVIDPPRAPSQTQRFIAAELEALRLNRLENALRTVGKSAPPLPVRRPKIPAEVQRVRIDTYNHPALLDVTSAADQSDEQNQPARGSNED